MGRGGAGGGAPRARGNRAVCVSAARCGVGDIWSGMGSDCPGFLRGRGHPCEDDYQLLHVTQALLRNSIAPGTRSAYRTGQACFIDFCARYGLSVVPATEATLTFFVGHLRRMGLSLASARQYLAAVRRLHLQSGWPMAEALPPYVTAALRGFEPRGAHSAVRTRHALTVQHLRRLKVRLTATLTSPWDQRCAWAACTLGFYGGLRSSEYLVTGLGRGARREDMLFTATGCRVRVGIQKNRQHGPAVYIDLPATGTSTCPVRALWYFCQAHDGARSASSALFRLESGALLTRRRLNGLLRQALGPGFSSHSLRIGLVTTAAAAGVGDDVLQRLGRWRSGAFEGYVRGQRRTVTAALLAVARC